MRMFSPKSPIVRLSLVLTLLTSGILVLSDLVGLFPSQYGALIEARKTVAETVAIQIASAVRLDSIAVIDDVLKALVDRDHALLSVAVRRSTGLIVASAGDHEQHWRLKTGKTSTETQVRVPLFNGKTEWGALELAFVPIGTDKTSTGLPKSFLVVVLFVVFGGFFAYMAFLRRALSELDPSAVVPQRVRGALDALAEGLVILDEQERILLANTAFARKLARTPESLVGVPLSSLAWLPADGMATLPPFPWNTVLAGEQAEGNTHLRLETAAKLAHTFALHAVGVLAADGAVRGALVTFDDLTGIEQANGELRRTLSKLETMQRDLARQNQELQVLATRDALSGSLNRRAIFEAFENLLRDSRETREELSCIMVDIDKFKSINDRYGHGVGDKVIKIVAGILNDTARATDLVGRYGGEEFCVLLPNTPSRGRWRLHSASALRFRKAAVRSSARRCASPPVLAYPAAPTARPIRLNCATSPTARCTSPRRAAAIRSWVGRKSRIMLASRRFLRRRRRRRRFKSSRWHNARGRPRSSSPPASHNSNGH